MSDFKLPLPSCFFNVRLLRGHPNNKRHFLLSPYDVLPLKTVFKDFYALTLGNKQVRKYLVKPHLAVKQDFTSKSVANSVI
jgi:hypothetical protein